MPFKKLLAVVRMTIITLLFEHLYSSPIEYIEKSPPDSWMQVLVTVPRRKLEKSYPITNDKAEKRTREEANLGR